MATRGRRLWRNWFLGLAALAAVIAAVLHLSEERAFVQQLERVEPRWLVWAILLQAATYAAQASVWISALARAGTRIPFLFACGMSLQKVFVAYAGAHRAGLQTGNPNG